jgi:hypothetical protein
MRDRDHMNRQHSTPILLKPDGSSVRLDPLPEHSPVLEAEIQALVHAHPETLPIAEIDPIFAGAVAVCRELQVAKAGRVDNFLITPSGLPSAGLRNG